MDAETFLPKEVREELRGGPDGTKAKVVGVIMDGLELWNAYICIHNLTERPRADFYKPNTKEKMVRLRDKLYRIGKEEYGWV